MARNPHQTRALTLIRTVHERGPTEVTIPESSRRVDFVLAPGPPSDAWGVLQRAVGHRTVYIEHFSSPPTAPRLASGLLKAVYATERWLIARRRSKSTVTAPERPPLMLILSVGQPRKALRFFGSLVAEEELPQGIYRSTAWNIEVILVDVKGLSRQPGTSFLRAMDHRHVVAAENLERLYADPTVEKMTKEQIKEAVMSEPDVFDMMERRLSYNEVKQIGRELGRKEGRKEGREEGREEAREEGRLALLSVVGPLLDEDQLAELADLRDLDELRQRAQEFLSNAG